MTTDDARVAWVESPLQLLNAIEWGALGQDRVDVAVRAGMAQVAHTAALLAPHLPDQVSIAGEFTQARRSPFGEASRRLIGDAHSGQVRRVLAGARASDLVLVDDGSGTLPLAGQIAERASLARPWGKESAAARALGAIAATRIHAGVRSGDVTLFTAYEDAAEVKRAQQAGLRIVPNAYAWLRRVSVPDVASAAETVILGNALAVDGLIDPQSYAGWVAGKAVPGAVYFPHRREHKVTLDRYARDTGVEIAKVTVPIEVVLASSVGVARVHTLPSSAIQSLRRVLAGRARVQVDEVPESWWSDQVTAPWREMLGSMRGLADE